MTAGLGDALGRMQNQPVPKCEAFAKMELALGASPNTFENSACQLGLGGGLGRVQKQPVPKCEAFAKMEMEYYCFIFDPTPKEP